jgi:ketosteroid isomerase-like protein
LSAVLAIAALFANPANSEPEDPVAVITQWEHDAAAADQSRDVSFFQNNLSDDWTDGMSNGKFQSKKDLISDLTDKTHFTMLHETLSDLKVRVYGDTAVATYSETDDALTNGERRSITMITTDTFVKTRGEWKEVSEHSSAVPHP